LKGPNFADVGREVRYRSGRPAHARAHCSCSNALQCPSSRARTHRRPRSRLCTTSAPGSFFISCAGPETVILTLESIHWIGNGPSRPEALRKQSQNAYEPKGKKVHLRKSTEATQNQNNRSNGLRMKRLAQVEILITPVARIASEIARP
jgi:hypothetical protein